MQTINEILEDNIDLVNELVNAAFRAGFTGRDAPDAVAEAIREFSEKALYARTLANRQMSRLDPPPSGKG